MKVRRNADEQLAYLNGLVAARNPVAIAVHAVLFEEKTFADLKELVKHRNTLRR